MDKIYVVLEKAVRQELAEHFPKMAFKLNTYKPKLAGNPRTHQYKVRG